MPGTAHALGSLPRARALARDSDILHAQAFASVLPVALARTGAGTPMVATFHTSHFLTRAEKPLWQGILGRLVKMPDHAPHWGAGWIELSVSGEDKRRGETDIFPFRVLSEFLEKDMRVQSDSRVSVLFAVAIHDLRKGNARH